MVLVSVIMPTYNRAHLLPRAIKSVLSQTFKDFELIIIDGGSIDNTEDVVKSFKDPRIIYINQGINQGISAAKNVGIMKAKGKYIAFIDSDDEWFSIKLEKQVKVFQKASNDIAVVHAGYVVYDDRYNRIIRVDSPRECNVNSTNNSYLSVNNFLRFLFSPQGVLHSISC